MAHRGFTTILRHRISNSLTIKPFRRAYTWVPLEPSTVRYEYTEEVERLDFYVPGGYHPVKLGDKFCDGRYIIVHKLGFGRSATVWLAEDKKASQLVALKISTAESIERKLVERTDESAILLQLGNAESSLPGRTMVQTLRDEFTFSGPNGVHKCLVSNAARVSIMESKLASNHCLFSLPAARAIASQIILGLQFIHAQGIVHGDLHLGNVFLNLPPDIQAMNAEQLYTRAGEPSKQLVVRRDCKPLDFGVPSEAIVPVWLGGASDELTLADASIHIADFGEAFVPEKVKQFISHTPPQLTPPECIFMGSGPDADEPLSFPGDIWTLGCLLWELFGNSGPFCPFPQTIDGLLTEHVEMLGQLPEKWWRKWKNRSDWFDDDGIKSVKEEYQQKYGVISRNWDQRFPHDINRVRLMMKYPTFSPEEEKAFGEMIKSMFIFEPRKRATIKDVVRCDWMQKWGLPEMRNMEAEIDSKSKM
ncbi:predicted protein [Uncinocarpus reesii 1704]|uniref:non-specific serine/threonine protein kinase n=1 Tax=Uncinocarpus reesii (strain UAMH 1704) TaxID=336963 RepID=C4JHI1_UNCRE|nr:uncharacterized protein UREG_01344 [Uncinocarpus reesii 1704]EEP76495.1 predicted protein [Uncinocarpus reesii 1704]